jgi:hypothetical protein
MRCQVRELQEALGRVKQLQGMLPICAWCKKVREDQNYWSQIEDYIACHSEVRWTHGMCPAYYESAASAVASPTICPHGSGPVVCSKARLSRLCSSRMLPGQL